jgi:hypothetical protein
MIEPTDYFKKYDAVLTRFVIVEKHLKYMYYTHDFDVNGNITLALYGDDGKKFWLVEPGIYENGVKQ